MPTLLTLPRLLVLVTLSLLASVAHAQTTTIIDTFGPSNSFTTAGTIAGSSTLVNAVRFTIPAGANLSIASVDMALGVSGTVSTVQIGIFNESGGLPVGMPIVFASVPGPIFPMPSFISTPFAASPTFVAGQSYWVAPIMTGTGNILWSSGLTGTTTASFFNGTTWAPQMTPNPLALRIIGVPSQVACCNARGTGGCLLLSAADCATIGGVATSSAICTAASCAANVTGACCRGSTCVVTTTSACTMGIPTGRSLGAGSSCTPVPPSGPNPCCPADFNNSASLSVQDIFDYLAAWFAGCP